MLRVHSRLEELLSEKEDLEGTSFCVLHLACDMDLGSEQVLLLGCEQVVPSSPFSFSSEEKVKSMQLSLLLLLAESFSKTCLVSAWVASLTWSCTIVFLWLELNDVIFTGLQK